MQAEWKAAAERFIEKRGYVAAEQLRATLQAEWQQLKAIRRRCCSSLSEVHALSTTRVCWQIDTCAVAVYSSHRICQAIACVLIS